MAESTNSLYYRYFIYSAEEEMIRKQIHGESASFGVVIVNGVQKKYTSIVTDPKKSKPDAVVVARGNIHKIKYIPPAKNK